MPHEPVLNAWGEEVPPAEPGDVNFVPEDQRKDVDEGPLSDALDDETGDDMADWEPILPEDEEE